MDTLTPAPLCDADTGPGGAPDTAVVLTDSVALLTDHMLGRHKPDALRLYRLLDRVLDDPHAAWTTAVGGSEARLAHVPGASVLYLPDRGLRLLVVLAVWAGKTEAQTPLTGGPDALREHVHGRR